MNRKSLIRVAGATVAGMFLFAGMAFAQSTPTLVISLEVSPHATPGTHSTVALVKLDASNSSANVRVPALTLSGSYSGGAGQSTLSNCSLALTNAINIPLNTGSNAVSSLGSTATFTFDTPVVVPAGETTWIGLVCSVDASVPQTGMITLSINPSTISAMNVTTNATIIPTAGVSSTGTQQISGTISPAPTTPSTNSNSSSVFTPGIPNTGAGGDAMGSVLLLIVFGLTIGVGVAFLIAPQPKSKS